MWSRHLTAEVCPVQPDSGDANGEDPKPGECPQRSQRTAMDTECTESAEDLGFSSCFSLLHWRYMILERPKLHKETRWNKISTRFLHKISPSPLKMSRNLGEFPANSERSNGRSERFREQFRQCLAGQAADNRDALGKAVYGIVFNYIVHLGWSNRCCN